MAFGEDRLKSIKMYELKDLKKKFINKKKAFGKAIQKAQKSGNGKSEAELALQCGDPRVRFVGANIGSSSGTGHSSLNPPLIDGDDDDTNPDGDLLQDDQQSVDMNKFSLTDDIVAIIPVSNVQPGHGEPVDVIVPNHAGNSDGIGGQSQTEPSGDVHPGSGDASTSPSMVNADGDWFSKELESGGGKDQASKRKKLTFREQMAANKASSFNRMADVVCQSFNSQKDSNNNVKQKQDDSICELVGRLLTRRLQNTTPEKREEILASHVFPALALLKDEEAN